MVETSFTITVPDLACFIVSVLFLKPTCSSDKGFFMWTFNSPYGVVLISLTLISLQNT